MCGILGFISNTSKAILDKRNFIEQGMIVGTLRGEDGTGLFAVPHMQNKEWRDGTAWWLRLNADGYSFSQLDELTPLLRDIDDYRAVVVHNRAATRGGITLEATHPFQVGYITLVHNGTLSETGNLKISQQEAKAANDSETIAYNLNEQDAKEVLESLNGSFALVWHDARDDSINIARNSQRPLHIAKAVNDDTVYFTSEPDMLRWLDKRNNIGLLEIVSVKEGQHIKFLPNKLLEPQVVPFQTYFKSDITSYGGYGVWANWEDEEDYSAMYPTGSITPVSRAEAVAKWKRTKTISKTEETPGVMPIFARSLRRAGVSPTSNAAFVPCEIINQKTKGTFTTVNVLGYLLFKTAAGEVLEGPPATVDVMINTFEKSKDRIWSVKPKAVNWISDTLPLIITSIVQTISPPEHRVTCPTKKREPFNYKMDFTSVEDEPKEEPEDLFLGPSGSLLSYQDWLEVTACGCVNCGQILEAEFAHEIEWVNNRQDPLCPTCVEEHTNPHKEFPDDEAEAIRNALLN